tara:strand:- start:139 stop:285 length:147 start_codon:yes stop_codon:yes gene_type:complete
VGDQGHFARLAKKVSISYDTIKKSLNTEGFFSVKALFYADTNKRNVDF